MDMDEYRKNVHVLVHAIVRLKKSRILEKACDNMEYVPFLPNQLPAIGISGRTTHPRHLERQSRRRQAEVWLFYGISSLNLNPKEDFKNVLWYYTESRRVKKRS